MNLNIKDWFISRKIAKTNDLVGFNYSAGKAISRANLLKEEEIREQLYPHNEKPQDWENQNNG